MSKTCATCKRLRAQVAELERALMLIELATELAALRQQVAELQAERTLVYPIVLPAIPTYPSMPSWIYRPTIAPANITVSWVDTGSQPLTTETFPLDYAKVGNA